MTATEERPETTAPERPPRSVPKPQFTDAEAGAKEFPDSDAAARHFNYYKPAKRKQTHYEDVTVEVQPDPRHYAVTLQVSEAGVDAGLQRYFTVQLEQGADGDWRVVHVHFSEASTAPRPGDI